MKSSKKQLLVSSLAEKLNDANSVIVINPKGLNVSESTNLRKKLRKENVNFKVIKNTLAKIALKDTPHKGLSELFSGPTAIAYSDDSIAAAKSIVNFAKENDKIKILGGSIDQKSVNVESINTIASLPSLDEIRAKIIGVINAPATKIVRTVKAPLEKLVRVFSVYSNKE